MKSRLCFFFCVRCKAKHNYVLYCTVFDLEELKQYLTLIDDAEEEEHQEEIDRLYSCLDGDDSSSDTGGEGKTSSKADKKKETASCTVLLLSLIHLGKWTFEIFVIRLL